MDLRRCRHLGIVQVLAVVLPRKLINHLIHVKSINAPKGAFFVEIYSLALRVTFFLGIMADSQPLPSVGRISQ